MVDEHTAEFAPTILHENWLAEWDCKPWSLDDPRLFAPDQFVTLEACIDGFSIMQVSLQHELPPPDWMSVPGHPAEARAFGALPPDPQFPPGPDGILGDHHGPDFDFEDAASSSSSHAMQSVFLFRFDDPVVHGRIDWTDYFCMMHDAVRLLNVDPGRLVALHEISVRSALMMFRMKPYLLLHS